MISAETLATVTTPDGEVSDNWLACGAENAIYHAGNIVAKVCLALPNEWLADDNGEESLLEASRQRVTTVNDEYRIFKRYFGDAILPTHAYLTTLSLQGDTVRKMFQSIHDEASFKLQSKRYADIPIVVTEQSYFQPFALPYAEAVSFTIGKGDYNHLSEVPDMRTYQKMNDLLLRGEQPASPLDLAEVYATQKSLSLLYYIQKIRSDPAFRLMLQEFIPKVANYTHETGAMIDVFPVIPNGAFARLEKDGAWAPTFYEMSTSAWWGNIELLNEGRRQVLEAPHDKTIALEKVVSTNMLMSYMRCFNALALECDLEPPFNICCPNGDPSRPQDCELNADGWWSVYERIQEEVDLLYGDQPKLERAGIYPWVWRSY